MEYLREFMNNTIEVIKYFITVGLSILKYSSWQILILIIFIRYKTYIIDIFGKITKVSYGGLQIEFKKSLEEIKKVSKPEVKSEIDEESKTLAKERPDMAVVSSFKILEINLRDLDEKANVRDYSNDVRRHKGAFEIWRELVKHRIISDKYTKLFKILSHMRNEAVHSQSKISFEDAFEYMQQVANLNKYLIDIIQSYDNQAL